MKAVILIFILVFSNCLWAIDSTKVDTKDIISDTSKSRQDDWFALDKAQHLVGSAFMVSTISWYSNQIFSLNQRESIRIGSCFTLSMGILKEIWDHGKPHGFFSWKDLIADVLGICMGLLIMDWW